MIIHKPLFKEIVILAVVVAFLHKMALSFHLYWSVWWFDILLHFLGGVTIGVIALFVFFTSGYIKYPSRHQIVVLSIVLGSVFIVGLVWELWELFAGFSNVIEDCGDTITDLVVDLIGAVTAYFYGRSYTIKISKD